jgi:hypothetical protein
LSLGCCLPFAPTTRESVQSVWSGACEALGPTRQPSSHIKTTTTHSLGKPNAATAPYYCSLCYQILTQELRLKTLHLHEETTHPLLPPPVPLLHHAWRGATRYNNGTSCNMTPALTMAPAMTMTSAVIHILPYNMIQSNLTTNLPYLTRDLHRLYRTYSQYFGLLKKFMKINLKFGLFKILWRLI